MTGRGGGPHYLSESRRFESEVSTMLLDREDTVNLLCNLVLVVSNARIDSMRQT